MHANGHHGRIGPRELLPTAWLSLPTRKSLILTHTLDDHGLCPLSQSNTRTDTCAEITS